MMLSRALINAFFFLLALASTNAAAKDCTRSGVQCVDSTPCKSISGVQVCLSDIGKTCWDWRETYTCLKPNAINYCQPFVNAQPACWQTNTTCTKTDTQFGSGCMEYTQTWRCGDQNMPTPTNTIKLDSTYTLISSGYDTSQCAPIDQNTNCQLAESVCTSTTPPALPPGVSPETVAPDGCFEKKQSYACLTGRTDVTECGQYSSNPDCSLQSDSPCEPEDVVAGRCTYQESIYKCLTKPESTSTTTDCSGQQFCTGDACYDRGSPQDSDFGLAMAMMETQRQAGVYTEENKLFGGEVSKCKVRVFGMSNCCKSSGGGQNMTNNTLVGVGASAGKQAVKYGSYYTYDSLMQNNSQFLAKGVGAISGATDAAANSATGTAVGGFTPSLSMYGFSVSWGAAPAGAIKLGSAGGMNFAFDPTSLMISVAIMVVMEMMSCDENEQLFSLKRGQNLCTQVGSYCSKSVLGTCYERTQSYCCFNSKLARIINEQGRAQIGKGWGTAKQPTCDGFTTGEFTSLDFSRIDMTEFINDIMANVEMPNIEDLSESVQGTVQTRMQSYYDQGNK